MDYHFQWRPVLRSLPDMLWGALVTIEIAGLGDAAWNDPRHFAGALQKIGEKVPVLAGRRLDRDRTQHARPCFKSTCFTSAWVHRASASAPMSPCCLGLRSTTRATSQKPFAAGSRPFPKRRSKAARSLGMGTAQTMWHVVIPQMLRAVFHAMTNQMVWSILMSSMGMIVGPDDRPDGRHAAAQRRDVQNLRILLRRGLPLLPHFESLHGVGARLGVAPVQVLGGCDVFWWLINVGRLSVPALGSVNTITITLVSRPDRNHALACCSAWSGRVHPGGSATLWARFLTFSGRFRSSSSWCCSIRSTAC